MKLLLCFALLSVSLLADHHEPKGEKEVLGAMENWKQAMVKQDAAAMEKLLHPDLSYSHSNAKNETKADVLNVMKAGQSGPAKIEFDEPTVRIYGNTALVKGDGRFYQKTGDVVHLNILTAWVKGPQGWQMVARQATRLTK